MFNTVTNYVTTTSAVCHQYTWENRLCLTCNRKVRPVWEKRLGCLGHLVEDLHSFDLLAEAMEHGLATAQKVGLQDQRHALAEVGAACHLTAGVPEEKVSDSLALESERNKEGF